MVPAGATATPVGKVRCKVPNWLRLIEHTAEFLPGPYCVVPATMDGEPSALVWSDGVQRIAARIPPSPDGRYPLHRDGTQSRIWDDPVQEATARLMSEADTMLSLLARMAQSWRVYEATAGTLPGPVSAWLDEAESLLARHVRIGFEPHGPGVHAGKGEPPPPPPAPTILDMIDPE